MPDPDSPERLPLVQPLWVGFAAPTVVSFSRVPGWHRFDVLVPFPWRLTTHPDLGAVYSPIWPDRLLAASEVYAAAREGLDGWRMAVATPRVETHGAK